MFIAQAGFLTERLTVKQNSFQTGVDAAMFENMLFNTLNGSFFTTSLGPFDFPHSYFADHVNLNLFFIIPVYFIFPYMETLFWIQSLVLASPILILYLICREWDRFSILPSVLYFFYLPVFWIGIFDVHFETLFIPFFLLFYHFEKKGNHKWKFISFLLCLFCKEETASVFMVYSILRFRSDRKSSILIFSVSIVYFILCLLILSVSRPDTGLPYHLYRFLEIPKHQGLYIYLIYFLFIPFLFFPFLSEYILLILPYLAYSFLSSSEVNKTPLTHHSFIAVPVILTAFIQGFRRFQEWIETDVPGNSRGTESADSFNVFFVFRKYIQRVNFISAVPLLLILISAFLFLTEGPPSKKYSYGKNFMKRNIPEEMLKLLKDLDPEEKIASNVPALLSRRKHLRLLDLQKTYTDETLIIYTFENRMDISGLAERQKKTHSLEFKFNDLVIMKPAVKNQAERKN